MARFAVEMSVCAQRQSWPFVSFGECVPLPNVSWVCVADRDPHYHQPTHRKGLGPNFVKVVIFWEFGSSIRTIFFRKNSLRCNQIRFSLSSVLLQWNNPIEKRFNWQSPRLKEVSEPNMRSRSFSLCLTQFSYVFLSRAWKTLHHWVNLDLAHTHTPVVGKLYHGIFNSTTTRFNKISEILQTRR